MSPYDNLTLEELFKQEKATRDTLQEAKETEAAARREVTAAMNRLSEIQKVIDKSFTAIKQNSPHGTPWSIGDN